jgi:hypothetical protein
LIKRHPLLPGREKVDKEAPSPSWEGEGRGEGGGQRGALGH